MEQKFAHTVKTSSLKEKSTILAAKLNFLDIELYWTFFFKFQHFDGEFRNPRILC